MTRPIDKQWFIDQIKAAGFSTQAEFVEAIGMTRPQWSNVLGGNRRLQTKEVAKIAQVLKLRVGTIMIKSGDADFGEVYDGTYLSGEVHENGVVEAFPYGLYNAQSEKFNLPFHHTLGWNYLKVATSQYEPLYKEGDILAVVIPAESSYRQEYSEIAQLKGVPSIIALKDHVLRLGLVYPDDASTTWTVVVAGPNLPPIVNVAVLWAADVQVIIPRRAARLPYTPNLDGVEFETKLVTAEEHLARREADEQRHENGA